VWKDYSFCDQEDMQEEDRGPKPGPIDNSHLLSNPDAPLTEQRLAPDLSTDEFCVITLGVWSALCSLYPGSGPVVSRPICCKPNRTSVRNHQPGPGAPPVSCMRVRAIACDCVRACMRAAPTQGNPDESCNRKLILPSRTLCPPPPPGPLSLPVYSLDAPARSWIWRSIRLS